MKQYADLNLYTFDHNQQTDTRGLSQYSQDTAPKEHRCKRLHKSEYTYQILDIAGLIMNPACNEIIEMMNNNYTDSKAYSDSDGVITQTNDGVMPTMSDVFNKNNNDDSQGDSFKDSPSFNRNDGDLLDQLYAPCEFEKMNYHYNYFTKNLQRWRKVIDGRPQYQPKATKLAIKHDKKKAIAIARMVTDSRYKANMRYKLDLLNIGYKNVTREKKRYVSYTGSEFPTVKLVERIRPDSEYCNTADEAPITYGTETAQGYDRQSGMFGTNAVKHGANPTRKCIAKRTYKKHTGKWYVSPKSLDKKGYLFYYS